VAVFNQKNKKYATDKSAIDMASVRCGGYAVHTAGVHRSGLLGWQP
jgi:hypothetical protein